MRQPGVAVVILAATMAAAAVAVAAGAAAAAVAAAPAAPQTPQEAPPASPAAAAAQLHAQVGQLAQAARAHLNGSSAAGVLEALTSVGKAIQQQMSPAVVIASAEAAPNSKKNEYQQVEQLPAAGSAPAVNASALSYREQGELLRADIARRAGQLQQVVAGSMELLKNNGDLIVRRLLEQLNTRLELARAKADRVIAEPAGSEVAVRALAAISQGLNNLNHIVTNVAARLEAAPGGQQQQQQLQQFQQLQQLHHIDGAKLRHGLHALGQQFSAALGQHQQPGQRPPLAANKAGQSAPT